MTEKKRAMALGFFDGIHIGHAALLDKTNERAAQYGYTPSVLTFDVHPDTLVFGNAVGLINSADDRKMLLKRSFNIEDIVQLHFDTQLMCMPWQSFAEKMLREMNIGWIVAGHDFRFGHRGEGTAEKLREYCAERNVGCDIIPAVTVNGETVSSTRIRMLIENGDIEQANALLGHPHFLTDTVRRGCHLGTSMGAPTVNTEIPKGVLIPRHGVYVSKARLEDGTAHSAVTNIGTRPTVSNSDGVNVESHLLDFSGDLYGQRITVELYAFIRDEVRFTDVGELSEQIALDAERARKYFKQH